MRKQVHIFFSCKADGFLIVVLLIFTLLFQACTPDETAVPRSTGNTAELLVVIDDHLWDATPGEKIRRFFAKQQEGLPQAEPMFSLVHVPKSAFNSLLKRSRNVLFIETGNNSQATISRDVWARPQLLATVQAKNKDSLIYLLDKRAEALVNIYRDSDLNWLQDQHKKLALPTAQELTDQKVSLTIPKSFFVAVKRPDFLWYRKESPNATQSILIYSEAMKEDENFLGTNIISRRNQVCKTYVEGELEGTYMSTELRYPPILNGTDISGHYAIETRGLWKMEGDFMGGPFLSYTIYDEKNQRIITAEGFVYAPAINKRNLMLELEAILKTTTTN